MRANVHKISHTTKYSPRYFSVVATPKDALPPTLSQMSGAVAYTPKEILQKFFPRPEIAVPLQRQK